MLHVPPDFRVGHVTCSQYCTYHPLLSDILTKSGNVVGYCYVTGLDANSALQSSYYWYNVYHFLIV